MDIVEVTSAMENLTAKNASETTEKPSLTPNERFREWCLENGVKPLFQYSDGVQNKRITCELMVDGYSYVGVGKTRTKRSAKRDAVKDFLLFLVGQNEIPALPKLVKSELKCLDVTPPVHGSWTIDAAKKRLKRFIKSNDKNVYKTKCTSNKNNYEIEVTLFVEKLNTTIFANEIGTSVKKATEKCSLSLVSQLCGLGQIERCLSSQPKKEKLYVFHDFVSVSEKLMNNVYKLLDNLNIKPINVKDIGNNDCKSLIINEFSGPFRKSSTFSGGRVISWCPPKSNWNTWLSMKISKSESLTRISEKMENQMYEKKQRSLLSQRIKERAKLPIFCKKNEILEVIRNNSVVIVQGGTGCGKTTQVCQFILDEFLEMKNGAHCNIICTQPRKVSAISIADRVAFERAEVLGHSVGYTVRFNCISPRPFGAILFCTIEILIRKLKNGLIGISHVIVDEIHERRADSDFLLMILKDMVQEYPELRVILMSANANLKTFSEFFNNCPVVDVAGRCYPVKEYFLEDVVQLLNYEPVLDKTLLKKQNKMSEGFVNCNLLVSDTYPDKIRKSVALINEDDQHLKMIELLLSYIENDLKMDGGVLIFLPGWAWISDLHNHLLNSKLIGDNCIILLLHSTLSQVEQHKVFKPVPYGMRKVILSTNIAETSVTIDDIVFVIDCGKVKQVEFSNNITMFKTDWVSKVNVEQRKGRAGRVQAGICFNLYTKERFNRMDDNVSSELTRIPLNKICLAIKLLNLGSINTFLKKAIDQPPVTAVKDALTMLTEIKCLDSNEELTALGNILAQLPVDPQFGRMMILGNNFMLEDALCTIVAGSSTNYDLFIGDDVEHKTKNSFSGNRCSDHLTFLNAFNQWENGDLIDDYGLSSSVLKTSCNIKDQIKKILMRFGFPECCFKIHNFDFGKTGVFDEPRLDMLSALLTMAFYPNVYRHKEKRKVLVRNKGFSVVGKSSVNCVTGSKVFQSPFFVFEEQVNVMCLHSTMVTPIHLLLFGARKVDYVKSSSSIVLDDWINLEMDVNVAAAIVALRPAIDDLILRTTKNPRLILQRSSDDIKLLNVLKDLCNFNAGRHNLSPITFDDREKVGNKTQQ